MIQPPETSEMEIGERPLVNCWIANSYTRPMNINIEKAGVDFAWCPALRVTVSYADLFETEREALESARKQYATKLEETQREIDLIDTRIAEIEAKAT